MVNELSDVGVSRDPYWEEMTSEQKIEKLAWAVEILSGSVVDLERENCFLRQHRHSQDEELLIPMSHNMDVQPWYKTHILNRTTK